ncbi:hypothetical protein JHK85_010286 [Glycine max]|nr:hypothetical protein JHK85_010286 [Glycine max]
MKGVAGTSSRPLVQEVCTTCGKHDSSEQMWMMFPGTDLFARISFHASRTILETAKSDGVRPIPSSFFQVVLGAKVVSLSHPRHRLD